MFSYIDHDNLSMFQLIHIILHWITPLNTFVEFLLWISSLNSSIEFLHYSIFHCTLPWYLPFILLRYYVLIFVYYVTIYIFYFIFQIYFAGAPVWNSLPDAFKSPQLKFHKLKKNLFMLTSTRDLLLCCNTSVTI